MKNYLFHQIYNLRANLFDKGYIFLADILEEVLFSKFFDREWRDLN